MLVGGGTPNMQRAWTSQRTHILHLHLHNDLLMLVELCLTSLVFSCLKLSLHKDLIDVSGEETKS